MSTLTPIEIPEGKHVLRILDNSGDRTITYDPTIEDEVAKAMAEFDQSMAKGMKAFVLDEAGGGHTTRVLEREATQTVVSPQYVGG